MTSARGRRLDLELVARHPGLSRRHAQAAIRKGQVSVDGRVALEPGAPVREGQAVVWDPNRPALPAIHSSLHLLYRDAALVVVDKPAGLLSVPSHPGAEGEDTVLGRLREMARRLPGRPRVGAVHRLDRDTSGALAVALSERVRHALRTAFREHRVERRYLALVDGTPRAETGTIELPIADAYAGGKRHVARGGEPAHAALTRWRVRERFHDAALVEVELTTGRQHQIRLHLAEVGLPVLGDAVYGAGPRPRCGVAVARQMLHAHVLGFAHPLTGAAVHVVSPPPQDLQRALAALRRRGQPRHPPRAGPARGPRRT